MTLYQKISNRLAVEYILDYNYYVDYPNTYNSKILDMWKEDFSKMNTDDKKILYNNINEKIRSCVDMEYYENAAIIRDALKNMGL